jgi:hypothetical protein
MMAKVANAAELVDGRSWMGVKGGDDFDASGVIAIASEHCLCFLVVPVVSEICIRRDMLRSRVRLSDDEINSKEGEKVGGGAMEVARKKEPTSAGWARLLVGMRLPCSMVMLWWDKTKLAQGAMLEQIVWRVSQMWALNEDLLVWQQLKKWSLRGSRKGCHRHSQWCSVSLAGRQGRHSLCYRVRQ